MKKLLLNVAVAAALASAGAAHAVATQVNFGFVPFGVDPTYTGASLGTSTMLNFTGATFTTNVVGSDASFADNSGAFSNMQVFLSDLTIAYTIGQTTAIDLMKTFNTGAGGAAGSQGLYSADFESVTAGSSGANFLNLTFSGSVTGPGGFQADDVMLLNCNQSGGQGSATNCSFTQQGPPITVPEPATLSLVALSLVGLLAASRRRRPR